MLFIVKLFLILLIQYIFYLKFKLVCWFIKTLKKKMKIAIKAYILMNSFLIDKVMHDVFEKKSYKY